MSTVADTGQAVFTGSAPAPSIGQAVHPFTDTVVIGVPAQTAFKQTLDLYLGETLDGCGTVDLFAITVVFKATDAKQTIKAGLLASGSNATLDQVANMPNGLNWTSNSYNFGAKESVILVPHDTLSTQIRPVPSDRPTTVLWIENKLGSQANVILQIKVLGQRVKYLTLNQPTGVI